MQFLRTNFFKLSLLSAAVGVFAGITSTIFLISLNYVTRIREFNPALILFLPVAGFVIMVLISKLKHQPILEGPLVLGTTLITHLFGGSAGRERTAVQLSTWASNQMSHRLRLNADEKKRLLLAAAGAGFGAAVGAPFAGAVFGLESQGKKLELSSFWKCLIASGVAFLVTDFLGAPHTLYPAPHFFSYSLKLFISVGLCALSFGLVAVCFNKFYNRVDQILKKFVKDPTRRAFSGGLFLVIFYILDGSYRYVGLGIPFIQDSFHQPSPLRDVFLKIFFTGLTLASGFTGGEFIPLVFLGTATGSYLSQWLPASSALLSAVGFASVFGAVSKTPLACTLVAVELFGIPIAPYALLSSYGSFYAAQRLMRRQ